MKFKQFEKNHMTPFNGINMIIIVHDLNFNHSPQLITCVFNAHKNSHDKRSNYMHYYNQLVLMQYSIINNGISSGRTRAQLIIAWTVPPIPTRRLHNIVLHRSFIQDSDITLLRRYFSRDILSKFGCKLKMHGLTHKYNAMKK